MSKLDRQNHTKFWSNPHLTGVHFLSAKYETHSFWPHIHEELVIGVIESGAARFVCRQVSDIAEARSLLVFNPYEPHEGEVARGDSLRYRALYIDVSALPAYEAQLWDRANASIYFERNKISDPDLADLTLTEHKIFEMLGERLEGESLFLNLLAALAHRHGTPKPILNHLGVEHRTMLRVRDYMLANLRFDISLGDLAALARMTKFHFIRAFRKELGLPPHAYLNQLRLNEARRLIAAGKAVIEVASDVGFYDQSHLIRHFKRTYGITPGQYAAAKA